MSTSGKRTLIACLGMLIAQTAAENQHFAVVDETQNRKARRAAKSNKGYRQRPDEEVFHHAWRK